MNDLRPVILAPTYNNARTLGGVIEAIRAAVPDVPILVVNDGATDDTAAVLAALGEAVDVVTHPTNRGKAAALRTGFDRAAERGFTHAVTIDTDAQHNPADIPSLLAIARANPTALIAGSRSTNIAGYPAANQLCRRLSNWAVRVDSGVRVTDSQCGLRVYPLEVRRIPTRTGWYGFETEILTRCGWANVPVINAPVQCVYEIPGGRVTHFRALRDSTNAMRMHVWLLLRAHLPWPPMRLHEPDDATTTGTIVQRVLRWFNPMRAWRAVRRDPRERKRFAAALSLGVLIANLPLYGVQTVLSVALAKKLRLHPLPVVVGSHLSTPPVGPLLIAVAIAVGHFVLHGDLASPADFDPGQVGYVALLKRVAAEWIVGSVICGVTLALLTYGIAKLCLSFVQSDDAPAMPEPVDNPPAVPSVVATKS